MGETDMNAVSQARERWLSVLARTPAAVLADHVDLPAPAGTRWVRPAVAGMVMSEGRAGGSGGRFSLGQVAVTRATAERGGRLGIGYIMGHDPERAERMALADLALQEAPEALMAALVEPEARRQADVRATRAKKAAATRVEFFTIARQSSARST
ncbi:MAG: phosphonate C-P lyase system protein PhnG [Pseudomonadota bacterium]